MAQRDKERIRSQYKIIRDAIPASQRKKWSLKIARHLFGMRAFISAKTIGIYMTIGSEAETEKILERCLALRKKVAAPKTNKKDRTLTFYSIKSKGDCEGGPYKILEPKKIGKKIDMHKLDLLLVPGIAFDKEGYRLGYGKGYYDRLLKKNPHAVTIGLTFEKNLATNLPHSKNDIPVSTIVTEKKVYG